MIFAVQSTPWLLFHELRLARRSLFAARGMRWRAPIIGVAFLVTGAFVGVPAAIALQRFGLPRTPLVGLLAALGTLAVFTLMLSQSLAAATETLYSRADLDLLLSSPIAPGKVLFAKCAGIAANAFLSFAILVTPLAVPVAVLAAPRWLAIYVVLAALALLATAIGLGAAISLFRLIGPRRTRTISQLLAALIGAGLFLVAQGRNLVGQGRVMHWMDGFMRSVGRGRGSSGPLWWPLRAVDGDPAVLAVLAAVAGASFAGVTLWVGRRFGSDAAAASGAAVGEGPRRGGEGAFAAGVFRVTVRKELRLLGRDVPLLAQVLLQILYLLPLIFLLLRNAGGDGGAMRLPIGVGAVVFVCGQVAGSLVWLTVCAEDAPELIGCAPASAAAVRRAKLCAALAPLAALMAVPLFALLVLAPLAGVAAMAGCSAAALCGALIGFALQKPAKRSTFRRRRSGSLVASIVEFAAGAAVAAASGAAVAWPPLLTLPLLVAGLATWMIWGTAGPPPYPLPKARAVVH